MLTNTSSPSGSSVKQCAAMPADTDVSSLGSRVEGSCVLFALQYDSYSLVLVGLVLRDIDFDKTTRDHSSSRIRLGGGGKP